ncbi:MAG TPA: hypothetical protein VFB50_19550 [Chloroflexota bacterium]|nr:hypothetical protein [Chloroflexota bacterium]
MSEVVPFPGMRAAGHVVQRQGPRVLRSGGVISWLRAASCVCCGRPTLAERSGVQRVTLCGHCSPPSIA